MNRRAQARVDATLDPGAAERPGLLPPAGRRAARAFSPPCRSEAAWTTRTRGRRHAGFTVIEVMIALGALALILTVLISISARSVRAANRAKMLTIATELARGKMLDIEETLLKEGFQDTAETMDGDFGEEGFERIKWAATIEKVELPEAGEVPRDATGEGSPLATTIGGGMGGLDGAAGASMFLQSFGMVKGILEQAIRKVTLTVTWNVGTKEESFRIVCYFTDPKAIDNSLGGLLGGGGPPQ